MVAAADIGWTLDPDAVGWFPPFKRLPHGQIGVDREFAMLIALLFWVLVLGLYVSFR
jgi:hypothetical protein